MGNLSGPGSVFVGKTWILGPIFKENNLSARNMEVKLKKYQIKLIMANKEVYYDRCSLACVDGFLLTLWDQPVYLLVKGHDVHAINMKNVCSVECECLAEVS